MTTKQNKQQNIDTRLSQLIISSDNIFMTILLFPFSSFFHTKMIWIPTLIVFYLSNKSYYDTLIYVFGMILTVITSTIFKRLLKRPRPTLRAQLKKPKGFRLKEKNNSLPSGDAIQSMYFAVFVYYAYSQNLQLLGVFHILVCISRVYFMCHWIGDTLLSTILAYPLGLFVLFLRENLRHNLQNFINSLII